MNKIKIIVSIIITIILVTGLNVFLKNKKIYITKTDELNNIKISMLKLEDEVTTVIKQVPTTGNWIMTYNCDDEAVKIYWDEESRKLLMKNIKPTACTIKFEESFSSVNVVSIYVDDIFVGELDENKIYDLVSYECTNDESVIWKALNKMASISPINKNTHCKLYFKDISSSLYNKILTDNNPQFDQSIKFDSTTGNGLYYTDEVYYGEDGKSIYYFRGRVDNNWVSFAGYLWRIVRTTSEGGVKLVYSGNGNTTSSGFISTSTKFNTNYSSKYYVGYTYNTGGYTGTQTNSTIKVAVDNWYNGVNGIKEYEEYLSPTAVYCNDRSSETGSLFYPPYYRIAINKRPSYSCPSANESRYTVSIETGNGYLQDPIALLTADEINYAGANWSLASTNSYIIDNVTSGSWWWTMSPYRYYDYSSEAFTVNSTGIISSIGMSASYGVRPAVSLKSCITVLEGNGNKSTPYILSNNDCAYDSTE